MGGWKDGAWYISSVSPVRRQASRTWESGWVGGWVVWLKGGWVGGLVEGWVGGWENLLASEQKQRAPPLYGAFVDRACSLEWASLVCCRWVGG